MHLKLSLPTYILAAAVEAAVVDDPPMARLSPPLHAYSITYKTTFCRRFTANEGNLI